MREEVTMKRTLSILAFMVLAAGLGWANPVPDYGAIGWYEDQVGVECNLHVPSGPEWKTYYLVHTRFSNATAVQFKIPLPTCMTWESGPSLEFNLAVGTPIMIDPSIEMKFEYVRCMEFPDAPVVIATYSGNAPTSTPCCPLAVLPGDISGYKWWDCQGKEWAEPWVWELGVTSYVNANSTCWCWDPIPVEETTWGQVKAMYRI
jgi:hypothetical protein